MAPREDEFLSFVAGILRVSVESISLSTQYESIPEWDSVMHLRLVLEIGERYGVEIPIEQIVAIKRLGEFFDIIRNYEFRTGKGT